ncbi:MAG: zinc-binding dehydrogenase [Candidatus Ratteibacteria bacterium]|nr:zinc-binding dehydrogenase [Candidatus Ratteibacteria bacterium]
MKAAITDGKGNVWLEEVPVPEVGPYHCLCNVLACATCTGTDIKIMYGKLPWKENYPAVLGHESVGKVIKTGEKVRYVKEGDIILRPTAVYPGEKIDGYYSIWGGFAEYGLVMDTEAFLEDHPGEETGYGKFQMKVPSTIEPADAIMLITLKETAGYVADMGITLNDSVVVLGAGPVAMSITLFCKLRGAFPVIVVARRDDPLENIKRFGANYIINNTKEDMQKKVMDITGGKGVKYIIDTAGDEKLFQDAFKILARDGKIAPYAVFPEEVFKRVDGTKILNAQTGEVPAHNYLLDLVRFGIVDLKEFYSHKLPFSEIKNGFEMLKNKEAFKVVFEMGV